MEKRAFERIAANLDARIIYGNIISTGIVSNLSENGMFISTRICPAPDSKFEVLILLNKEVLKLPAKVRRLVKTVSFNDAMGAELLNPPKKYLEFVDTLRFVFNPKTFPYPTS